MTNLFDGITMPAAFSGWTGIGLEVAFKSGLILGLAGIVVLGLRRASAAKRHLVWSSAMASLFVLPLLTLVFPSWHLSLLPYQPASIQEIPISPASATLMPVESNSARHFQDLDLELSLAGADHSKNPTAQASAIRSLPPESLSDIPVVFWIWLTGTFLSLVPLVMGIVAIRRRVRQAQPILDQGWPDLMRQASQRLGLRRSVRLLQIPQTTMPLTWATLRPVLLLPVEAAAWTEERRRLVLLHELAHVKRWDCLTQFLAQIVCALYWFNPLAWLALYRMRLEREQACDDLVLASGFKASEYANQLLSIANSLPSNGIAVSTAIAMAHPSRLEGRLKAILDGQRNRQTASRKAVIGAALIMGVVTAPLATLTLTEAVEETIQTNPPIDPPKQSESTKVPEPSLHQTNRISIAKEFAPYIAANDLVQEGASYFGKDLIMAAQKLKAALDFDPENRRARYYLDWVNETVARIEKPTPQRSRAGRGAGQSAQVVVGKGTLTYQGQQTTWEELPSLLFDKVPDRPNTVLLLAIDLDGMSLKEVQQAGDSALTVARRLGIEYAGEVLRPVLRSQVDMQASLSPQGPIEIWGNYLKTLQAQYAALLHWRSEMETTLNNRKKIDDAEVTEKRNKLGELKPILKRRQEDIEAIETFLAEAAKIQVASSGSTNPTIILGSTQSAKSNALVQEGLLYYQNDDLAQAEKIFQEACDLDPDNRDARYYLHLMKEKRFELEAAKRGLAVKQGLAQRRSQTEQASHLKASELTQDGVYHYQMGDLSTAAKQLLEALQIDPEHRAARYYLNLVNEKITALVQAKVQVTPRHLPFGPVVERTLGTGEALDLDSDKLRHYPDDFVSPFRENTLTSLKAWATQNGADVCANELLYGIQMAAFPITADQWNDYSIENLRKLLTFTEGGTPVYLPAEKRPAGYAFRTREGGPGLLQIVDAGTKPTGSHWFKIRFKLTQDRIHALGSQGSRQQSLSEQEQTRLWKIQLDAARVEYMKLLEQRTRIEISINNTRNIGEAELNEKRQKLLELKTLLNEKKNEIDALDYLLFKQSGH